MTTNVRITILVDDRAKEGLVAEHGLSLLIETGGRHILFDTGQREALAANARTLGVDLARTEIVVLSHGHYDHTGGIADVLDRAKNAHVYCHPGVLHRRYSVRGEESKPIHMPQQSVASFERLPAQQLHWAEQPLTLFEGVGITGPIPRDSSYEDTGGPFYLDPKGTRADPIEDDLALWINTENGLVVCVGCSHAGIVNTLNHVRRLADVQRLSAVIGGFHLLDAGSERVEQTVAALRLLSPDSIIPCHCTGEHAATVLRDALGDAVIFGSAGMTYLF